MRGHKQIGRYSVFMDSHALLVRTVATLARRQIALEALQGKGISKEDIAEAAGQVPIPQINPECGRVQPRRRRVNGGERELQ